MIVTVFTPTFNRAYILPQLYDSLKKQTCKDFEWLIVDDGSTDKTEELVKSWLNETLFPIRYIKQQNGGKHRAINRGVQEAKGELFFIIDSDDYPTNDAIEEIKKRYENVKGRHDIAGVIGFRLYADGRKINQGQFKDELVCNVIDYQYRHHGTGDMAEAYRTSVLREYPFPDIEVEKFCTESLVWNRIGCKYKMLFFNKGIYVCDYLEDGLTRSITKIRHKNPVYATLFYSEAVQLDMPFTGKIKNAINYWRFYFDYSTIKKPKISFCWYIFMPFGLLINIKERKLIKE